MIGSTLARAGELVRRLGPAGAVRYANDRLVPWTGWVSEMVWYGMDLQDPDRPRRALEPPLELRRGTVDDMPLLDQLPADSEVMSMTRPIVAGRLADGAALWLVTEGDRAAFRCWIFRGAAPLQGAPGGKIPLPPEVALLEDSLSSPDFRGRGVAPGAWSTIADGLAATDGLTTLVTKVSPDNAPTRKAVEKAGFREIGMMRTSGPVWRMRIAIELTNGASDRHAWLRDIER